MEIKTLKLFFAHALCGLWALSLLSGCAAFGNNTQKKVAQINIQLGMSYIEKQDYPAAYHKLKSALTAAPTLPEAWYSLAYYYEKIGKPIAANQCYLNAIHYAPRRPDVHNNYGVYLCKHHAYRKGIQQFELAARYAGQMDVGTAYINAGFCALKIPDRSLALGYFQQALKPGPYYALARKEIKKLKLTRPNP